MMSSSRDLTFPQNLNALPWLDTIKTPLFHRIHVTSHPITTNKSSVVFKHIVKVILLVSVPFLALGQGVKRTTYYDQEKTVVKEKFVVNDTIKNQLNGIYISYYLSGSTKSEGYYINNKASHDWVYYFESGNIKQTGSFLHGRTVGIWTYYFENGNIRSEGILSNNKKEGEWIYNYENGRLKRKGQYDLEIKIDVWNYYYEDGGLKADAFFKNGAGIYNEYYMSGQLKMTGLNRLGKSDSLWRYYYESGEIMAKGYYKKGVKNGPWKYYYKNGELSAVGGYEDGMTLGNWIYYYPNGKKSAEGLQKNDLKDGYWKMFYETGETKGIGEFDEGSGTYKEYYISGKLKVSGQFQSDLNFGRWTYYDEEGNKEGAATFDESGVGQYEGYYLNGDKKMEGKIVQGRRVGEWTLYKKNGDVAGKYHPVYTDSNPAMMDNDEFIRQAESKEYEKPEYHYSNKTSRYFSSRVNEYKGVIFGTNPLYTLIGYLPIAIEYYIQERQGYEFTYTYIMSPFFKTHNSLPIGESYSTGTRLTIKQKFYSEDQPLGMTYFGHIIGADFLTHAANTGDTNIKAQAVENRFFYGLLIGDRWLKEPNNAGISIDVYVGLGIGVRNFSKQYTDPNYDKYFVDINQSDLYIPLFFGINIGYLGFKKTKNITSSTR